MTDEPITVGIRDLGIAAALVACGFDIEDINRDTNGRVYFIFQETAVLAEAVNKYYADKLHVRARKFFDAIKALKILIYSGK